MPNIKKELDDSSRVPHEMSDSTSDSSEDESSSDETDSSSDSDSPNTHKKTKNVKRKQDNSTSSKLPSHIKQELSQTFGSSSSEDESSGSSSDASDSSASGDYESSQRDRAKHNSSMIKVKKGNIDFREVPVLQDIVETPSEFDIVEAPGPLTLSDIKPDNEYYIFRFPLGLINPTQLVDTKFRLGIKEAHRIEVNKKPYEVSTYENSTMADVPALFIPDNTGQLNQVDLKIESHIVIKQPPLNPIKNTEFNIDDLRSRVHEPPDIKERNFFGSSDVTKKTSEKKKEEKGHSKEKKKISKEKKKKRSLDLKDISSPLLSPKKKKEKN